jgi:lambda family phage portal protein
MSLFSRLGEGWRAFRGKSNARGFNGAAGGRLYADWFAAATSADSEIRGSYRKLLDRSRDLARNNDYMRGFLLSTERNILGAIKHDLRMDCGEQKFERNMPPKWIADKQASSVIEQAWQEWGRKGVPTVCGRYSWRGYKQLSVRSVPEAGNVITRKIVGKASGNRFGFALQILEIDHLDLTRFEKRGENEVRFGVETNPQCRVVAYWLITAHPGDSMGSMDQRAVRIPAEELYHLYVPERAEQTIGIPWVVSAITRLRQLGAFEEAAVIAARLGASKAAWLTRKSESGASGDWTGPTDGAGNPVINAAPGSIDALPENWDVRSIDWQYPNFETSDFRKAMLRGIATSFGMSYNTLGNDLESVNFSSARVGLFEEREGWKSLQLFFSEGLWEPIFTDWLEAAIMSGAVALPMAKMAKFNRPMFKQRRWAFIDPKKELDAAQMAIALRLSSRSQYIDEQGGDRDDVFIDNLHDEEFAEEIGLSLTPPDTMPETFGNAQVTAEGEEEDDVDEKQKPKRSRKSKPAHPAARTDQDPQLPLTLNLTLPPPPAVVPFEARTIHVKRDEDGRIVAIEK